MPATSSVSLKKMANSAVLAQGDTKGSLVALDYTSYQNVLTTLTMRYRNTYSLNAIMQ